MKKKLSKNREKGLTLIELMITVFVISVGLVATMSLIQDTLRSAAIVHSNLTAAYLAQEGVELVRNIRDTNWIELDSWDDGLMCPDGCQIDYYSNVFEPYNDNNYLVIDENGFYRYGGTGIQRKFKRKITTTMTPENYLEIESIVSWDEEGENKSIKVINHLYDWR
jgi:prepilin-type N-terminal cleavage/methylation domain-containing protein